jgi:hypothetical protein
MATDDGHEAAAQIISEAAQTPKAVLLLLGSELHKRFRQLLAAPNCQQNINPENLSEAIDKLRAQAICRWLYICFSFDFGKIFLHRARLMFGVSPDNIIGRLAVITAGVGFRQALR